MVEFTINKATPSLNTWQRMHFRTRHKAKKWWLEQVWAAKQEHSITDAKCKRKVIVTRYGKMMDADNLAAGCKPLLDAMVKCELLVDDSPEWLILETQQVEENRPKQAKTVVKVEQIGGSHG